MTSLFDSNLQYLREHQSLIYSDIMTYMSNEKKRLSFHLVTDEVLNIECSTEQETFLLYSKFDPQYECERWLQSYQLNNDINVDFVVYGLGLTYHLTQIITNYPQVKLFIYEPEIGIFIEALKVIDVKELFTHKNIVKISVGQTTNILNEFTSYVYYYAKFPIRVLDMPIYRSINAENYLAFLKIIEKVIVNRVFKNSFYNKFGDQMFRNSLRNMIYMYQTPSIDILKGKFEGCTAIVVGGGPSLQYDVEYLKKNNNNSLIIAAGSSVQSLVHFGVEPHLIVSMDPGIYNCNVFTKNDLNHIPLLYMPQIHYQIVETHNEYNVFAYYDNDVIINNLIDINTKDYTFEPTYSVTGTAIQAAIYLGAKTIVFTGQDLSYPGKQMYSPGAVHHNIANNKKEDSELTLEVDNVVGTKNPTTLSMKTTLDNIQSVIESFPEVTFINSSSKGAVIKGTNYIPIQTALEAHTGEAYDFNSIKSIIADTVVNAHPDFIHVRDKTLKIVKSLSDLIKICVSVGNELEKLVKFSKVNELQAEKVLRKIESQWKIVIGHSVFKDLVEEWMTNELNTYDQRILEVSNETNIIEKANLLKETLGTFSFKMKNRLKTMKQEYTKLLEYIN